MSYLLLLIIIEKSFINFLNVSTPLEQLAHYLPDFVICCKVSVKKKHIFSFLLQATFFAAFSILFQNGFIQVKVSSSDVADFRQNKN